MAAALSSTTGRFDGGAPACRAGPAGGAPGLTGTLPTLDLGPSPYIALLYHTANFASHGLALQDVRGVTL
jgi:hypothetical protein